MRQAVSRFLVVTATALCAFSTALAQSTSARGVVDAFVKSWNTHDMKAFSRLFTEDAVWVPVAETLDKGRPAIIKDLTEAHKTWAGQTTIRNGEITIRTLSPTVSTLFFHLDFLVGGKPIPEIQRAFIIVATKKSGKWQIAAGQLTKQHDGE